MSIENELMARSGSKCELCASTDNLSPFEVQPTSNRGGDENVLACESCKVQMENPDQIDANHWRCLNDSMWSEVPAVQVVAYRMLTKLAAEGWPQDLLDMLYLEEETLNWAKAGLLAESVETTIKHVDSNGATLAAGDTVVLTQDLVVKGRGSFTAKRGTAVRNISLDHDNAEYIEGKVEGQHIVILTKFTKKS